MSKFHVKNLKSIEPEFLLKATPFVKNTRLNFNGELNSELFFAKLFQDRIPSTLKDREKAKEIDEINDQFDKAVEDSLRCLNNEYSRVDMLHIAGYGGCGKTTYLRNLMRVGMMREEGGANLEYVFTDFEGKDFSYESLLDNIDEQLKVDFQNKSWYLQKIGRGRVFKWSRFGGVKDLFQKVVDRLAVLRNRGIDSVKYDYVEELTKILGINNNSSEELCYFLLVFNFLLLLYEGFDDDENETLVSVFDNIDSIENQKEEALFFFAMKKFVLNCNFFFNENISNNNEYGGYIVGNVLKKTKILFLLATRLVTKRRFEELYPDRETEQGWKSLMMPEHYYDHWSIINKRIKYFEEEEINNASSRTQIDNLHKLRDFSNAVYRTNSYRRLFNGNIRYCFETLIKLNKDYEDTGLIDECKELRERAESIRAAGDGANGIVLALLLDYFKRQGVYEDKLHLSICKRDNKISLSRLILTFIKDSNNHTSVGDLYSCLGPYYSIEELSKNIFALSEIKRDVWRRMLTFGAVFPGSEKELLEQLKDISEGNLEKVSELHICLSGIAYLEHVIPHFEYLLSRHKVSETIRNFNYRPLFSKNSLDVINEKAEQNEDKYVFERKINWVYQDVSDCCDNSVSFAQKVIERCDYTRNEYLDSSKLNYLSTNGEDKSVHQSYESRLIFGHVSYIERYRQYIIAVMEEKKKGESEDSIEEERDINRRLVVLIKKYLDLYRDNKKCFQTINQTKACKKLLELVEVIEKSGFNDFSTTIELN